jgi:hypothetical protein
MLCRPLPHAANHEMVITAVLLQQSLAVQEDLLKRIAQSPRDRPLQKQSAENTVLIHRLIQEYRMAIARYLSRLSRSQLVF